MVNDLLEVRTYKIMEAARSLKKINESMLFDVELSYYRSLYSAFKGYSKIRNLIVDGQEIKDIHLTNIEQKESIPNSLNLETNSTIQQIETRIITPEISNNSIQTEVKIEETIFKMDSPVIEQPKLEKTLKTERKYDGFYTLVRILKPIPALVGEDFEIYGPFQPEDITNLPNRNAQILIEEKMAKSMGETG